MTQDHERLLTQARASLKAAKRLLNTEISAYPTPISGCDAQFNHLLGTRQQVSLALYALDEDVFVPTPHTPTAFAGVESR